MHLIGKTICFIVHSIFPARLGRTSVHKYMVSGMLAAFLLGHPPNKFGSIFACTCTVQIQQNVVRTHKAPLDLPVCALHPEAVDSGNRRPLLKTHTQHTHTHSTHSTNTHHQPIVIPQEPFPQVNMGPSKLPCNAPLNLPATGLADTL